MVFVGFYHKNLVDVHYDIKPERTWSGKYFESFQDKITEKQKLREVAGGNCNEEM